MNPNPAFQVEGAKLVVNAKREKRLEKHNFFAITGTNCTVEFSLYMGFFDPEKRSDPSIEENYTLKNISGGRDDQNCPLELPYGSDFQQIDGKGLLVITDCVTIMFVFLMMLEGLSRKYSIMGGRGSFIPIDTGRYQN